MKFKNLKIKIISEINIMFESILFILCSLLFPLILSFIFTYIFCGISYILGYDYFSDMDNFRKIFLISSIFILYIFNYLFLRKTDNDD